MEILQVQYHIVQRQRSADWESHKKASGEVFLQVLEDGIRLVYRLPNEGSLCGLDEIRFMRNLDTAGKIVQFRHFMPESLLSEAEFSRISIAVEPACFSLVPDKLFETTAARDLLKLAGNLPEESAVFSENSGNDSILVFSVEKEWADWATNIFNPAELVWTTNFSGLLNTAFLAPEGAGFISHISPGNITCMYANQGRLFFLNRFPYRTENDLLYFLLLALEQCNLEAETHPIRLSGSILPGSAGFEKLSRYAGNLSFTVPDEVDSLLPPSAGLRHPVFFDLLSLLNQKIK